MTSARNPIRQKVVGRKPSGPVKDSRLMYLYMCRYKGTVQTRGSGYRLRKKNFKNTIKHTW